MKLKQFEKLGTITEYACIFWNCFLACLIIGSWNNIKISLLIQFQFMKFCKTLKCFLSIFTHGFRSGRALGWHLNQCIRLFSKSFHMLINSYSGTRWEVLLLFLFNSRKGCGSERFNGLCLVYHCWRIKFYAGSQFFQGTYQHLLLKCHKIAQALYCCRRREHLVVEVVCTTEHAYAGEIAQEHKTCANFELDSGVMPCVYLSSRKSS